MNKTQLSNYFKNNPIIDNDSVFCLANKKVMTLREYSTYKTVSGTSSNIDDSRTICQMLRNSNQLSNYEYHRTFTLLVNLANNAVYTLGSYSKAPGNAWGEKDKSRSVFTPEKRALGQYYMDNPHHNVFDILSQIKNSTKYDKVKDYLVEISYYFERINSKILEYEQKENNG
jgi:hypothetical protein